MKNLILSKVSNTNKKFVKFTLIYSALPLVLLLGACSSNYVPETDQSSTYDFSKIETYSVIGDEQLKNPMFSDIDRERFDAAIDISMQQHSIEEVSVEQADVLVSYFVVTKDKVKVSSNGGYASNCYRCGYSYGGGVTHISSRNYVEGTLVFDIVDNKTNHSVYRSTLTKPLKSYETAEERQQAINKVVSDMMQKLQLG
ncbi:DUF4136 domain-containing protein [Colwellia psychrerythraea]|uniref:DUF4136 domain-containing protein n=1 Tax=Colwellia psychrerythraea TaxID=28229 RepID=A0A099KG73_COLPS|nr:DUF4136 domain-containing protein [Colwellia psychrerythraea]KGJ89774.1 protein of unknown function DUF4136 [Colwellia psychrerythraea]